MKATIIIPAYNTERFIGKTLDSALNQSYQGDYEVLVVNDGSKDETGKMIDRYYGEFPGKIKIIHQKNRGVGSTRNTLLERSEGEILIGLDSDDLLHPLALERVVNYFNENPNTAVVYSDHTEIDEKDKILRVMSKKECHEHFRDLFLHCHFLGHLRAFRRNIIGNTRFDPNLRMSEDYDFLLKLIAKNPDSVSHIPENLYFYRVYQESVSHNNQPNSGRVIEDYLRENNVYGDAKVEVVPVIENGFKFWDHLVNGELTMKPESKKVLLNFLNNNSSK